MAPALSIFLAVVIALSVLGGPSPYFFPPSNTEAYADSGSAADIIEQCEEHNHGLEPWQLTITIAQCPTIILSEKNDTLVNGYVKMAGSGSNLYVVWNAFDRLAQEETDIVFKRSTDNGDNFEPIKKINGDDQPNAGDFQISASGPYVFIVWVGIKSDNVRSDIFFSRSTDYGQTFDEPVNISNSQKSATYDPHIVVIDSNVYIAWKEIFDPLANARDGVPLANARDGATLYIRSSDYGSTFSAPFIISGTGQETNGVIVKAVENYVYVIWDGRIDDGSPSTFDPFEIIFTRSTDYGNSFEDPVNISNTMSSFSGYPNIEVSGRNIYIAWHEYEQTPPLRFVKSMDYGETFGQAEIIGAERSNPPLLSASDSSIASAWCGGERSACFAQISYDDGFSFPQIAEAPAGYLPMTIESFLTDTYVVAEYTGASPGYQIMLMHLEPGDPAFYEQVPLGDSGAWSDLNMASIHFGENLYLAWHGAEDEIYFKKFYIPLYQTPESSVQDDPTGDTPADDSSKQDKDKKNKHGKDNGKKKGHDSQKDKDDNEKPDKDKDKDDSADKGKGDDKDKGGSDKDDKNKDHDQSGKDDDDNVDDSDDDKNDGGDKDDKGHDDSSGKHDGSNDDDKSRKTNGDTDHDSADDDNGKDRAFNQASKGNNDIPWFRRVRHSTLLYSSVIE